MFRGLERSLDGDICRSCGGAAGGLYGAGVSSIGIHGVLEVYGYLKRYDGILCLRKFEGVVILIVLGFIRVAW